MDLAIMVMGHHSFLPPQIAACLSLDAQILICHVNKNVNQQKWGKRPTGVSQNYILKSTAIFENRV